ncbi:hypothetical protein ACP70R_029492 [Stipagrostis hirtigluma subsp. patula]
MEGKRAAAAALCLMLVLLSGQQHKVAAMSPFCACYKPCYSDCKKATPGWMCTIDCLDYCAISHPEEAAPAFGAGDCSKICLASICGTAETAEGPAAADVHAACAHDCTKNWSRYKNKHT